MRAASSDAHFGRLVDKMREAAGGQPIERPAPAVEILGRTLGLRDTEKQSVLENLIRGQDYSRWGALNAVTALANDHDDYDRATELESAGGLVLDLPPTEWRKVAEAA